MALPAQVRGNWLFRESTCFLERIMFHLNYINFIKINLNIYKRTIYIKSSLEKTGRGTDAVDGPDTNLVEPGDHSPWPGTARPIARLSLALPGLSRPTFRLKTCSFSIPSHHLLHYWDASSHYIQPIAVEMILVLNHGENAIKKMKII